MFSSAGFWSFYFFCRLGSPRFVGRSLFAVFDGGFYAADTVEPYPDAGIFNTPAVVYNRVPVSLAESRDDRAGISKGMARHFITLESLLGPKIVLVSKQSLEIGHTGRVVHCCEWHAPSGGDEQG